MKCSKKCHVILTLLSLAISMVFTWFYYDWSFYQTAIHFIIIAISTLALMIFAIIKARKKLLIILYSIFSVIICAVNGISQIASYMESAVAAEKNGVIFENGEMAGNVIRHLSSIFSFPLLGLSIILLILLIVRIITKDKKGKSSVKEFMSAKATCAICGKEIGLNRYKIGTTTDGRDIWKCPECTKKGGLLNIDYDTGKVTLTENKDTEVRVRCNTCGHVYCYTLADIQENERLAKSAVRDSLLGVGEAIGGTRIGSQMATSRADDKLNRIVDYSKCPKCNSMDVKELTKEEWELEKANMRTTSTVSTADELKKFKELLDIGAISQEEFDTKKKQLLGM